MKKRLLASGLFLFFISSLTSGALQAEEVKLRYGLKDNVLRIVLQAETDRYVSRAKVYSTYSLVKVEFPGEFNLLPEKVDYERFEYNKKGKNLYLNIKNLRWVKLLRLKSPPRLVIDAYLRGGNEKPVVPQAPEQKSIPQKGKQQPLEEKGKTGSVKLKRIVIDPGHGGRNLGIYTSHYSEKSIVLRVARTLRYMLRRQGRRVYLTRSSDRYVSLMKRIMYIRKRHPDLMVSIHMSTSNNFVIYTEPAFQLGYEERFLLRYSQQGFLKKSENIAKAIGDALLERFGVGVLYRKMDIPVIGFTAAPALVIELPAAEFFDYTSDNVKAIVNAIVKAIGSYEQS